MKEEEKLKLRKTPHKTPVLLSKSCLVCNYRVIYVQRLLTSERDMARNAALVRNPRTCENLLKREKGLFGLFYQPTTTLSVSFIICTLAIRSVP